MKIYAYILLLFCGFIAICTQVFTLYVNPYILFSGFIAEFVAVALILSYNEMYD